MPLDGAIYTAQWEINKYTVIFDANGGVGGASQLIEYGANFLMPDTPTRENYNFIGWFTASEGGELFNGENTVATADLTFYAHWECTWFYNVKNSEITITGYVTPNGDIAIPSEIDGCPVTAIVASAFESCSNMTSIVIPGSVTSIGNRAFYGCSGLTSIVLPAGLDTIGYQVFEGCSGLTSVTIPNKVNRIGSSAFLGCGGLTSVTIPDSVREIASTAFRFCTNLTSVTVPASVTSIGDGAFRDCSALTEVFFEGNAPTIGASVFDGVSDGCHVIVSRDSTGWGASIPGTWNGLPIDYSLSYNEWSTIRKSLDVNDSVEIATSEPTSWFPVSDISARVGSGMARSAAVGNRTNSWLSVSVSGSGTMAFWCKTSCEHDEDGTFAWDCLRVYTNDVEIVEWRMDGETYWTQRAIEFLGGDNTVKWVYYKDNRGSEGEDCAWVDGVDWMPDEPTNVGGVSANWFIERVSGYSEDEDLSARGYELSGAGSLSVVNGVRTAYLKVDMNSAEFASYTPNPAGRDRTVSTIVARIQAENVFTSMFDELPEVAGQQGGVCIVKCDGVNAWFGLTATGWRRLYSSAPPPELGEWYDVRAEIDNRDSAARKVRYSAKHAEDSNFVILADEDDEIWLPNACATPIGKVSKICFGRRMNVGDFYGSQTPAANLIVSGNGEVSQGVNRGYVVVANEGRTLEDGDFSFSVAREAYVVVIASDGKSATVSLKPPVLASGQGEAAMSGDGEDADKDEDDPSGVLVDAADVVARFGTDAIKAIPTAKAGETIGVLPVKTYSGLYYRVSWGADLNNLISGDKVLARGDTLFLGVIKQTHGKGFYKITVSEQ